MARWLQKPSRGTPMKRAFMLLACLATTISVACADELPVFRVGVLNDQSGLYADIAGPGSVEAARMAVEDFKPEVRGFRVEVLAGDHQNKPDIGSAVVRRWFEAEQVDAVADVPTSSVALAVASVARDRNKVFLIGSAGASDLTGCQRRSENASSVNARRPPRGPSGVSVGWRHPPGARLALSVRCAEALGTGDGQSLPNPRGRSIA